MATIYTARAFRPDRSEMVARHLQKLRTGDEVDKSLYQCLHNIREPNETYLFWKTDPPCLDWIAVECFTSTAYSQNQP